MVRSRLVIENWLMFALVVAVSYGASFTKPADILELTADDYATAYLTPDATRHHPGVAIAPIRGRRITRNVY